MEATPICQAWLRPDGGKGIRNKVLVLYTVECSKHVAESIAAHFQAQHRDVDVTGSLACLDNQAVVQRMLAYCVHPNVGAVLIVGHGCEYIEPDRIRDFARAHGRPAEAFYLQKVGGTEAGIALGCRLVGEMLEKIEAGPRAPMYAQELTVAQARKAYSISDTRYRAGAGTILELNSAQLAQTQAELNFSQAIFDYLTAKAEYDRIVGKEN